MVTPTLSIPDDLKAFVEEQAARQGLPSADEYVRRLLRDAQARQAGRAELDALLH